MIVRVVMSSATRVPAFSFDSSTFVRQPTTYLGPLLAFTITAKIPPPDLDELMWSLLLKIQSLMYAMIVKASTSL